LFQPYFTGVQAIFRLLAQRYTLPRYRAFIARQVKKQVKHCLRDIHVAFVFAEAQYYSKSDVKK